MLQQAYRISYFPTLGFRMSSSAVADGLSTKSAVGLIPQEVLVPQGLESIVGPMTIARQVVHKDYHVLVAMSRDR